MPREDAMNPYKAHVLCNSNDEKLAGKKKKERDADVRINAEIKAALTEFEAYKERQAAFQRLLICVQSRTRLLKPTSGEGSTGWAAPVFLINRLKNLAARQAHWLHPCDTWEPPAANLRSIFRSLASHLFTRYPITPCMDSAWDVAGPEGFRQQSWYIRLGRGVSIRALNLPLVLTRNMAHHFRYAPDHCTVIQALRYGEVRGLGGSEGLAREVAIGKLGQQVQHANFWRTVLCFFVMHPEMQLEYVNPIIDFIHYNKFAGEEVLTESGTVNRPPPWPDFSIKGRTLNSIMRLVRQWHGDLSRRPSQSFSWRKSYIPEYSFLDKRDNHEDDLHWTIRELLDSEVLHAEGQAMHHCVYSYTPRCRRGETTIWSLRLRLKDQEKRMATIDVDPRRRSIIQVRDKFNSRPGARSREIIRQWADWAGLKDEWCI
jgi:hypothetical protein